MFGPQLKRGSLAVSGTLVALAATMTACAGGQADKADPVGRTTATLNGYWKSTDSNPGYVSVYFKWGTTTEYEHRPVAPATDDGNCVSHVFFSLCSAAGPANTVHKYSAPLTGLAPNTTYHVTLCANDGEPNRDICGSDKTFKTAP